MKREKDGGREEDRETDEEQREGRRTEGERESKTQYSTPNKQLTHNRGYIS